MAPAVVVLLLLGVAWLAEVSTMAPALPTSLERYLSDVVHPSAAERRRLLSGAPLTKMLDGDTSRQVSVFGAIWINGSPSRYVEAVNNIETFEDGRAFKRTRRISTPPRVEDFDDLRLPETAVADLRMCRLGDCAVKLDAQGIEAFRTQIDWNAPDRHAAAEALMRRVAFERSQAYLAGGNRRLPVYQDKPMPISAAEEFRALAADLPVLTTHLPDVHQYLLDYPQARLPGVSSFLYWQETEFGLKPTIRISHLMIREQADVVVVATKMIYANHYFRSALELRVLIPDPARGPGFWFTTVVSSRTDGLSGFTGLFVRRRVRSEAREGTESVLLNTKRKLETPR